MQSACELFLGVFRRLLCSLQKEDFVLVLRKLFLEFIDGGLLHFDLFFQSADLLVELLDGLL